MTTVRPGPVDVLGQQPHEALLLLDHPHERAERGERDAAVRLRHLVDAATRSPSTKSGRDVADAVEARRGQAQRPRHEPVVEHALVREPLEDRLAHVGQRQARELGVEVVRGLLEIARADLVLEVDDLVRDLRRRAPRRSPGRGPPPRGTNSMRWNAAVAGRRHQGEGDGVRRLRQHVRAPSTARFRRRRPAGWRSARAAAPPPGPAEREVRGRCSSWST